MTEIQGLDNRWTTSPNEQVDKHPPGPITDSPL